MSHDWNESVHHAIRMTERLNECKPMQNDPSEQMKGDTRKHSHYFKDVRQFDQIDVYRVLHLFNVTDPCLQHAVKKLLVAGGRGAGKPIGRDVQEAIDTLNRWIEMRYEDIHEDRPS